MRVKMLIATGDVRYTELISDYISNHYTDVIEVSVCNDSPGLQELLSLRRYDVALMDAALINNADSESIKLPLALCSEYEADEISEQLRKVSKYQRISAIVADVLEQYAKISGKRCDSYSRTANITAIWSPSGGAGKTTVALAYAASSAAEGKGVFYLNLESFSSVPAYFNGRGKSISTVFDMLDNGEGNVKILLQGIRCSESGVSYLCEPDNFDDICILSPENITELVTSCAQITDELVIDLSSMCDMRTRQVFELADKVLLVTEPAASAEAKLSQFTSQNNVFESIREKTTIVANKGAAVNELKTETMISLPFVQVADADMIFKTLKDYNFKT